MALTCFFLGNWPSYFEWSRNACLGTLRVWFCTFSSCCVLYTRTLQQKFEKLLFSQRLYCLTSQRRLSKVPENDKIRKSQMRSAVRNPQLNVLWGFQRSGAYWCGPETQFQQTDATCVGADLHWFLEFFQVSGDWALSFLVSRLVWLLLVRCGRLRASCFVWQLQDWMLALCISIYPAEHRIDMWRGPSNLLQWRVLQDIRRSQWTQTSRGRPLH